MKKADNVVNKLVGMIHFFTHKVSITGEHSVIVVFQDESKEKFRFTWVDDMETVGNSNDSDYMSLALEIRKFIGLNSVSAREPETFTLNKRGDNWGSDFPNFELLCGNIFTMTTKFNEAVLSVGVPDIDIKCVSTIERASITNTVLPAIRMNSVKHTLDCGSEELSDKTKAKMLNILSEQLSASDDPIEFVDTIVKTCETINKIPITDDLTDNVGVSEESRMSWDYRLDGKDYRRMFVYDDFSLGTKACEGIVTLAKTDNDSDGGVTQSINGKLYAHSISEDDLRCPCCNSSKVVLGRLLVEDFGLDGKIGECSDCSINLSIDSNRLCEVMQELHTLESVIESTESTEFDGGGVIDPKTI